MSLSSVSVILNALRLRNSEIDIIHSGRSDLKRDRKRQFICDRNVMRPCSLHPKYLDPQGLAALWRESLLPQIVLAGATRGYMSESDRTYE